MLVLSRKPDEQIIIALPGGWTVTMTVIEFDRGKVRLGFSAPAEVQIYRREICPPELLPEAKR